MRSNLIFLLVISSFLLSCSSNSSPPAVEDVAMTSGSVVAGGRVVVWATYRVAAVKTSTGYQTTGFSSVIALPVGATYIPASSTIINQGDRAPDENGNCADGRTFLVYNFKTGEIADQFDYKDFAMSLSFDVTLQLPANKAEVIASAEESPYADPCGPLTGKSATFGVTPS